MDKAGDILKNLPVFSNLDKSQVSNYVKMYKSWNIIAGDKLSQYSRIKDVKNKSLLVEVDHPAIMQLLQMDYHKILGKLQEKYPELEIADIRVYLKNPEIKEKTVSSEMILPGDDQENNGEMRRNIDINSIDNEKFRDLLLNMKKRAQV